MALNQLGLGFLFTARDEASHVIHKLERSLGRLGTAQKETFKQALVPGAIGGGLMLGGFGMLKEAFDIAKEGGQFQQKLADIKSISGVTEAELGKLRAQVIGVGLDSQYGPEEAIDSFRRLAQSGFEANDAIKLLQPTLQFAAGSLGQLNPEMAGATLVQAIKAFGLEASQAGEIADKFLSLHKFSDAQFKELPMLIGRASRGAAAYGASLDEVLVIAGLARNTLGTMSIAATSTSVAFERMINPKFRKGIEALGVEVVDRTTGKFRSFTMVLKDLMTNTKYLNMTQVQQKELLQKVFGRYGMGAVGSVIKQVTDGIKTMSGETLYGTKALDHLLETTGKSKGLSALFANQRLDNLEGQLQLFHSAWKTLRTVLGESLADIMKPAVQSIRNGLVEIVKAWEKLSPAAKQGIMKMVLAVIGLVTAFGTLVAAKASIVVLTGVLSMFGTTLTGLVVSMAPVAAGLLLFAGLAYLVYDAYKTNFGGLADFVDGAWQKISLAVQGLVQLFTQGYLSGAVMDEIDKTKNAGIKDFLATIWVWGNRIKNFFKGIGEGFGGVWAVAKPIFKGFLSALSELGGAFGISVGKANDNVNAFNSFGEAGKSVGRVLGDVLVIAVSVATWMIQKLTGVVKDAQRVWAHFGVSAWAALDIVTGALQIFFGALSGDGETFWRGFTNLAFGSVKAIVGAVYGMMASLGDASDWMTEKLTGGLVKTHWGDFFREARKNGINELNESQKFWLREASNAGNIIPGAGMSKMWDQQPYTPIKPDDGEKYDAHGDPLWLHKSAKDISAPSVAEVEAQKQTNGDAMRQLADLLQKTLAGRDGKTSTPSQQLNVNIDGQNLLKIMLNAAKADAAHSYQTPAAETP